MVHHRIPPFYPRLSTIGGQFIAERQLRVHRIASLENPQWMQDSCFLEFSRKRTFDVYEKIFIGSCVNGIVFGSDASSGGTVDRPRLE